MGDTQLEKIITNIDRLGQVDCHTEVETKTGDYLWVINNFKSIHLDRDDIMKSSLFSATGDDVMWYLKLFKPRIDYQDHDDENKQFIDFGFIPECENFEALFPISGKFRISILGQRNETVVYSTGDFLLPKKPLPAVGTLGTYHFISRAQMWLLKDQILAQNKLSIFFEFSYVKKNDTKNISIPLKPFPQKTLYSNLSADFEKLFNHSDFHDITISVKGRDFFAHKTILAARSSIFKAMFEHNMQESKSNHISITDIDEDVFHAMLRYIYTGKVLDLQKSVDGLLAAADKYDLEELKLMCEKELCRKLSADNFIEMLVLADMYHADCLKTQALKFIKSVIPNAKIMNSQTWNLLTTSHTHLLKDIFSCLIE